jgi:hypothetical protein
MLLEVHDARFTALYNLSAMMAPMSPVRRLMI